MTEELLTEGAKRALESARKLAERTSSAQVEPVHLLWALVLEESRASEILAECGLTSESLESVRPLGPDSTQLSPDHSTPPSPEGHDTPSAAIANGDMIRAAVELARQAARASGGMVEAGTEHLLWGLSAADISTAQLLQRHGLEIDRLTAAVDEKAGVDSSPIDVDFRIRARESTETDRTDTLRIIDAAANRAREGMRVLEDFVRFSWDDVHLTGCLKELRHELTALIRVVAPQGRLAARDTRRDVGTRVSTAPERVRAAPHDVIAANFKRVQEALRTLEEFAKLIEPELSQNLEQLRYRLYTLEKAVLRRDAHRERLEGCRLYLLVSEELCRRGSGPVIREALAAGVNIVQVREKTMPPSRLIEFGRRVREWTRRADALSIINDRPDLAVLTDADGVHVGQDELTVREVRRIVGPDRLIGVSTHSIEQARRAVLDGADYLGVGPVFPSQTKQFQEQAGLEFVRQVAGEITLPWFAIGGIQAENIDRVLEAGASRVAVSHAICAAEHPGHAAAELVAAMERPAGP